MSTYIYAYWNEDWEVWFYVGVGSKQRAYDIERHSGHIRDIFDHYNCEVCLLKSFPEWCDNDFIDQCEFATKSALKGLGHPIIDGQSRSLRRQRQAEGISLAKLRGAYKGRKPIDVDEEKFVCIYKVWKLGLCTAREAMAKLGLKPNTFYRRVKEYENK